MVYQLERVVRVIIALITLAVIGWGQGSNTVYQTLRTTSNIIGPTTYVRNIGQISHEFLFIYTNAPPPAGPCLTPTSVETTEGSFDNVTYFPFGMNSPGMVTNQFFIRSLSSQGPYPFVRANLVKFDNANCRVTVLYSGVVSQAAVSRVQGAIPIDTTGGIVNNDVRQINPIYVGGVGTTNGLIGVTVCDQFATVVAAGGAVTLVQGLIAGERIRVCEYAIKGDAGNTLARLFQAPTNACAAVSANISPPYILPAQQVAVGSGIGMIGQTAAGTALCFEAVGAQAYATVSYAIY